MDLYPKCCQGSLSLFFPLTSLVRMPDSNCLIWREWWKRLINWNLFAQDEESPPQPVISTHLASFESSLPTAHGVEIHISRKLKKLQTSSLWHYTAFIFCRTLIWNDISSPINLITNNFLQSFFELLLV